MYRDTINQRKTVTIDVDINTKLALTDVVASASHNLLTSVCSSTEFINLAPSKWKEQQDHQKGKRSIKYEERKIALMKDNLLYWPKMRNNDNT